MNALPAHLRHLAGRGLSEAAQAGIGGNMPAHISLRQNRFRLVDAANNEKPIDAHHLDVIIVDVNPGLSKQFYGDAYDPKALDFKPPTCSSDDGIRPLPSSPKLQADACADCPNNEWGSKTSAVSGKLVKACQDGKKLAVMVEGMVFLLRVPPASLKGFAQYSKSVAGNNAELNLIVTRLRFDDAVQGVLTFTAQDWIDEKTANAIAALDERATGVIVGRIAGGTKTAAIAAPEPRQSQGLFEQSSTQRSIDKAMDEEAAPQGETTAQTEERKRKPRATKAEMEERRRLEEAAKAPEVEHRQVKAATAVSAPVEVDEEEAELERRLAEKRAAKVRAQAASDALKSNPAPARFGMQEPEVVTDDELSRTIANALNLPLG